MTSNAKDKTNLLNLPLELRLQIFHDYFKVEGGYVYNAESDSLKTADNRPIELSLMSTCRPIANDTRHLPLSINTVKFSTLYREDWRSLAGCFNLVASYHSLLQSDFVMHLARFMTPDIFSQLAFRYPKFESQLRLNMLEHEDYIEMVNDDFELASGLDEHTSTAESENDDPIHCARPTVCISLSDFFETLPNDAVSITDYYNGYATVHVSSNLELQKYWPGSLSEIQGALSYCLQLLAENNPTEFANHVSKTFPRWTGTNPVQDFMNLGVKPWEIPSEAVVVKAINLLELGNVWDLPSMWYYTPSYRHDEDNGNNTPSFLSPGFDQRGGVHVPFGVRCREKIRFSAAASAIHFLERRICVNQRTNIRNLMLHEDFRSVNAPSSHAQGLVPFFKENPLLRVERRADWLKCVDVQLGSPPLVAAHFQLQQECELRLNKREIGSRIALWLSDALSVTDAGVPAGSFTFVLEAGPHRDYATNMFQQHVHRESAWARAFRESTRSGSSVLTPVEISRISNDMISEEDMQVIDHLVNQTSSVLRCDFDMGIVWDVESLVEEAKGFDTDHWVHMWRSGFDQNHPLFQRLPPGITYTTWAVENFEIQTEDEYFHSMAADH
jgi:hypothetical protein